MWLLELLWFTVVYWFSRISDLVVYDKYKNKTIFGYQTTMKPRKGKKYDTYNTNGYCFVYQYYDVSKIEKDYESLFEKIKNYISKASELLKNM